MKRNFHIGQDVCSVPWDYSTGKPKQLTRKQNKSEKQLVGNVRVIITTSTWIDHPITQKNFKTAFVCAHQNSGFSKQKNQVFKQEIYILLKVQSHLAVVNNLKLNHFKFKKLNSSIELLKLYYKKEKKLRIAW